jgi:hypothetical protein
VQAGFAQLIAGAINLPALLLVRLTLLAGAAILVLLV